MRPVGLGCLCRRRRGGCLVLHEEQGLDGIPLLLGYGLQLSTGTGRNRHLGIILIRRGRWRTIL